jgi:16S rRNA processing protein RimM
MLTVGTIVSPHGVRGEMNVRLQTDDPEHLLTVIRLQGVSTPETVDRLRGMPLRMRGSDARPLAANEYFLYQVIGLEAFDEAGVRLGRVTDLIETGANDVLVVTPDEGADLLLPSHPDVILELDPAAGRLVARPLTFYGE